MTIKLTSFSYRSGEVPSPTALTLDCRRLDNPHKFPSLRALTGKDKPVQKYCGRTRSSRR